MSFLTGVIEFGNNKTAQMQMRGESKF